MVDAADHSNQPIFPEYRSPTEWPYQLNVIVAESRRILSYYKSLPEEAQPPKSIWHSPTKCADWIKVKMDPKSRGGGLLEFNPNEIE